MLGNFPVSITQVYREEAELTPVIWVITDTHTRRLPSRRTCTCTWRFPGRRRTGWRWGRAASARSTLGRLGAGNGRWASSARWRASSAWGGRWAGSSTDRCIRTPVAVSTTFDTLSQTLIIIRLSLKEPIMQILNGAKERSSRVRL